MWKKYAVGGLLALVVAVAVVVWWMGGPRFVIGLMTYGQQVREGSLAVGDDAPNVTVASLDGTGDRELGEWIGERPLVLVFGSFT